MNPQELHVSIEAKEAMPGIDDDHLARHAWCTHEIADRADHVGGFDTATNAFFARAEPM